MERLDSANVARVVARMDAIAAAQAHPIAVTDSVHWRFPLFWVTSPMGAGLDLSIGVIGTGASSTRGAGLTDDRRHRGGAVHASPLRLLVASPPVWDLLFFATFVRRCHDGFGSPTGLACLFSRFCSAKGLRNRQR
jgi:hypothetical protein